MSADPKNVLVALVGEFEHFVTPLEEAVTRPGGVYNLLATRGWHLAGLEQANLAPIVTAVESLKDAIDVVRGMQSYDDFGAISQVLDELQQALGQVDGIRTTMVAAAAVTLTSAQAEALAKDLLEQLVIAYLRRRTPKLYHLLVLLTVLEVEPAETLRVGDTPTGALLRYPLRRPTLHLERLGKLITDPVAHLKDSYLPSAGMADDDAAKEFVGRLFGRLEALILLLGGQAVTGLGGAMSSELTAPNAAALSRTFTFAFRGPQTVAPAVASQFGASVVVVPASGTASFGAAGAGLEITPFGVVGLRKTLGSWTLGIQVGGTIGSVFISRTAVSFADASAARLELGIQLLKGSVDALAFVIGGHSGVRLEIGKLGVSAELALAATSQAFGFLLELDKVALVLSGGEGDGFLAKILPKQGIRIEFDLAIGWSNVKGLYFRGSAGLEVTLPIQLDILGVIKIEAVYLALKARADTAGIRLEMSVGATTAVKLGPVSARIERFGVKGDLTFPPTGGNLGPANIALGFKPPNGIGLKIEAEAVTGGGYLFFDFEEESYAGVAQIKIQDFIDIKLVGLLTTRLPELPPGEKGFSLLLIVSAEFSPITLAFGFTLNGVGGLIGIHRKMMLEPLRAGVKNRTLSSILFPKDPVGRATQIISDLKTVFPPALNRFVLGPMVKLGWGSPSLLTLEIGIIIEIPMPIRIALLGILSLELPNPKAPLVVIHMDILGTLDIARCDISLDATLYDSRIVIFTLTGDMAMRLNWGESPEFILSIGGFNPRFQAPANFPPLGRLALSLATSENPRLRLETYIAVTSNSFQMGAKVDIHASADIFIVGKLTASAYLGFDLLFQFDPFHFIAELYGGADIQRNGASLMSADLRITLDGPGPFHALGTASVNFLGRHEITFQATIGEPQAPEPMPTSQPLPLLRAALADARNWSVVLPARQGVPVTLREQDPAGAALLHPFGGVKSRQTVVPLNTAIERFGNTAPDSTGPFVIEKIALRGTSKVVQQPSRFVKERFAPGQYFAMSDEDKISRPSFELRDAGVELTWEQFDAGDAFDAGPTMVAAWEYDTIEIDVKDRTRASTTATVEPALASSWLSGSVSRQARLDETGSARYVGTPRKITVADTSYVLIDTTTGAIAPAVSAAPVTYTDAIAACAGAPGLKVVGQHEVSAND